VSDVAQPSDGPPKLPSDYRAFLRPFRWPLMYGPWALGLIGLAMVGVGLFGDRPTEIALAAIGFGAAMVIASVLLPRMQGPLELGPSGVKGAVHGLPTAFMVAAVTAREVAEEMIPADEPDKERRVNEVVGHTLSEVVDAWFYQDMTTDTYSQALKGIAEEKRTAQVEALRRFMDGVTVRKPEEAAKKANPPTD